jgi:thiosulfate reductase cytochrome b subunit
MDNQPQSAEIPTPTPAPTRGPLVRRHRLSTRLWHWTNVVAVFVLLMSGLMIFNAHPRLYWGQFGANPDKALFEIGSARTPSGTRGFVRIGSLELTTTGVLGVWRNPEGVEKTRAFPYWATIPSSYNLALARRWHLLFAWVLVLAGTLYIVRSVWNGHLRRDLAPRSGELRPSHIWHDIKEHARLRFPTGEAARNYNILQKLAYLGVLLVCIPAIILTGMTMSPGLNATFPFLLDLFGGRQSARTIHFVVATLFVAFILVHLLMVVLAGPFNEVRSMITGRYRLPVEKPR